MLNSLWPHGLQPARLLCPWDSPGQNTGVVSHSFFQGIFPTQELNSRFPHCRWILYQLSHQRSPKILEWVAYPFFRGSSWPRDRTGVSYIAVGFFTSWATREVSIQICTLKNIIVLYIKAWEQAIFKPGFGSLTIIRKFCMSKCKGHVGAQLGRCFKLNLVQHWLWCFLSHLEL